MLADQFLATLPYQIQGEIREKIKRKPNRLEALQQELQYRGLAINHEAPTPTKVPPTNPLHEPNLPKYHTAGGSKNTSFLRRGRRRPSDEV